MLARHRPVARPGAVALALALAACGGGSGSAASEGSASSTRPGTSSTPGASQPAPALDDDFPDPDVMRAPDGYYAYATQRTGPFGNLQVATSKDLRTWNLQATDPLPKLPAWATAGRTWAPDVSAAAGRYLLYFAAHSVTPDVQCVGVATAARPTGPFTPVGSKPLVCPADLGGAIDPASFVDADGTRYVLYKNDGNCCRKDTWLWLQKTSSDGLRLTGVPVKLIKQDQAWEGDLIEAPDLVRHGSTYTLLYSANDYASAAYGVGYATASSITGPYRKAPQPLLTTANTHVVGPGGEDVVDGPGNRGYVLFHGWDTAMTRRALYALPLTWRGGVPVPQSTTGG